MVNITKPLPGPAGFGVIRVFAGYSFEFTISKRRSYHENLMEPLRRVTLLFFVIISLTGCSTLPQREAFFENLSPDKISQSAWKKYTGIYKGTIHSSSSGNYGVEGVNMEYVDPRLNSSDDPGVTVAEVRLELSGTPEEPQVYLEMQSACTSVWVTSGNYLEKFTNIPQREYGVHARLLAYSHAPNQLLISLKPQFFSPNRGAAMILTFRGKGYVDIEYIGHFSRRGTGNLTRVPAFGLYTQ